MEKVRRTDRTFSGATVVIGLCAGAAAGAGLALMFAPRSGPHLRRSVSEALARATDAIALLVDDVGEGGRRVYRHAREGLTRVGKAFNGAVESGSERLRSIS